MVDTFIVDLILLPFLSYDYFYKFISTYVGGDRTDLLDKNIKSPFNRVP